MRQLRMLSVGALVVSAGVVSPALASIAEINPAFPLTSGGPSAGIARYRASQTNWDQALIAGTTPVAGMPTNNIIGATTSVPLSAGRSYRFQVQNLPGEGVIFTLDDLSIGVAGVPEHTLSWGTFITAPAGTNAATINGAGPFDTYYNTLHPYARVQNRGNAGVPLQDNRVAWSDLVFTSSLTNVGSFFDGSIDPIPAGDVNPADDLSNFAVDQWIFTQTDLRTIAWTFGATVTLDSDTLTGSPLDPPGGGEALQFELGFKNRVPSPGAAALLGAAGMLMVRRRRA